MSEMVNNNSIWRWMTYILQIKTENITLTELCSSLNVSRVNPNFVLMIKDLEKLDILRVNRIIGTSKIISINKGKLGNYLREGVDFENAVSIIKITNPTGFWKRI